MRTDVRAVAAVLLLSLAPALVDAQQGVAQARKPVLFVCEHGTVKSLLAKVLFEQYASEVGLKTQAISRGTHPDSAVPPWMIEKLTGDHVELGSWRPQTLRPGDLTNASVIVSFDVPAATTAGARVPQARWDSLPSVSRDYVTGRDAIKTRIRQLVDSLARADRIQKR